MVTRANGKVAPRATTTIETAPALTVPSEPPPETATIQFRTGWAILQQGEIPQGGQIALEYDQDRLSRCREYHDGLPAWDSAATLRYHPSGQTVSGPLVAHIGGLPDHPQILDPPAPVAVVAPVPLDAESMECWFERHSLTSEICQIWDSRYGQNYLFPVARRGPARPVIIRVGAIPSLEVVNLLNGAASKRNVFPRPAVGSPDGTDLQTWLTLDAWVRNIAYVKDVWADVNVFDQADALIHAESFMLAYRGPAGGGGDLFAMDGSVYQGAHATPGSVSPRPDARKVQYRLYYEANNQVFTDAILHQELVLEDAVVAGS